MIDFDIRKAVDLAGLEILLKPSTPQKDSLVDSGEIFIFMDTKPAVVKNFVLDFGNLFTSF